MRVIANHRDTREATAFERALFPQSGLDFETGSKIELVFDENRYGYSQPYKGGTDFKNHLFRVVGDLESSGEEYECAVYLERLKDVKAWVRNTSRQPHSFWLQTSSDRFDPDFLALLNDGRVLVVEYKGAPYFINDDSKAKRLVGELWAERSSGEVANAAPVLNHATKRAIGPTAIGKSIAQASDFRNTMSCAFHRPNRGLGVNT
jgi:type III restriction enzyme